MWYSPYPYDYSPYYTQSQSELSQQQPSPYDNNLQAALPLIRQAVQDERNDERFYDYLIRHAPNEQDRQIIKKIRDDERRHRRMFREIYFTFTGQRIEAGEGEPFRPPASYLQGLEQAILGETEAIEKYRKIYFAIPGQNYKNMVFEILTDEIKHGIRYNWLYAKNKR